MKVCFVVSAISPGSGISRYVCSLAGLLASDGYDIHVITTHGWDMPYERRALAAEGISNHYFLGHRSKASKYLHLIRVIRRLRPDFIMVNYNAVVQYVLPFLPKSKVINVIHGDTNDIYRVASINSRYVDHWIAPSQGIRERFNEYTKFRFVDKVEVLPHGVPESVSCRHQHLHALRLIFVGVLYDHKGVKSIPVIMDKLLERSVDFTATIVGDGPLYGYLQNRLSGYISSGVARMTGVVDHDQVYKYLSQSDVLLYPTQIDSFGLVIAEAMINGAMPIVSLIPGVTDRIIDDWKEGFLLPRDDIHGFVDRICMLAENTDMLDIMRRNAQIRAQRDFSLRAMRDRYIAYFDKIGAK